MSLLSRLPRAFKLPGPAQRLYSTIRGPRRFSKNIQVSEEVRQALAEGKPVVALESAIITHGLPYPDNVQLADRVERIIREVGAIPATTAVINGVARVGLDASLIEVLGSSGPKNVTKVSRRDLPYVTSIGAESGGTTVAGTMVLAHHAGIKVFATGGIGGVHRGAANSMDISADLAELGRTPVAVVCSGPKPFLDIERTLEYLETAGVPAITFGKKGAEIKNFIPLFYSRDSRFKAEMVIETPKEAAGIIYAANEMGLENGQLFMNPIPERYHIPYLSMKTIITGAVTKCRKKEITGKAVTPYTLNIIREQTKGTSVLANKALVENNALMAAQIAMEYAKIGDEHRRLHGPDPAHVYVPKANSAEDSVQTETVSITKPDVLVVGSIAIDLSCDAVGPSQPATSNPSHIQESLGGVGHNVATAAYYTGAKTKLLSAVGKDLSGDWALQRIKIKGMDPTGIQLVDGYSTARYVAFNDEKGDMNVAGADMSIIEELDKSWILGMAARHRPKWLCIDGNLAGETIKLLVGGERMWEMNTMIAFEPTSVEKAARIIQRNMRLFPKTRITLVTPNELELAALFEAAKKKYLFENEKWFKMIDELNVNSVFNNEVDMLSAQAGLDLRTTGLIQQAVQLAPYLPAQLIKLGARGVLSLRLVAADSEISENVEPRPIVTQSRGAYKLLLQHFPAEKAGDIVSVNGVGDTFLGVFLGNYARNRDWENSVHRAQKAAVLTLASRESVAPEIEMNYGKYLKKYTVQPPVIRIP